jgi:hypothetical protein
MANARRWRLVRVPEALALRLERLTAEMERAYSEGKVTVPNEQAERIPLWLVISRALDEQEARRARSARPRTSPRTSPPTKETTACPAETCPRPSGPIAPT